MCYDSEFKSRVTDLELARGKKKRIGEEDLLEGLMFKL